MKLRLNISKNFISLQVVFFFFSKKNKKNFSNRVSLKVNYIYVNIFNVVFFFENEYF